MNLNATARSSSPLLRAAIVASLSVLAACASTDPVPASLAQARGTWQLDATVPQGGRIPTLTIQEDGGVHGNGGVNQYSATVDVRAMEQGLWRMTPPRSTRMAGPQEAMALEQSMLTALREAEAAQLQQGRLCLLRQGRVLVRFVRPSF